MEIETLKRSHLKRNIIIGVVAVGIISAIVLNFTRAKYRVTESIPLVNGTINYMPYDFKMVAMYQENDSDAYERVNIVPESGYVLNESKSYCEVNNVKDNIIPMVYEDGRVYIGVSTEGTKCYLYFDKSLPIKEALLNNYSSKLVRDDFNLTVESTTTGTIYYEDMSKGRTYYFAGNPTDNWVHFGGFYWRIIRINEDGTVRIIYHGNISDAAGDGTQIQIGTFNSTSNNNMYVGYMYQNNQVHGLISNGTIKGILDQWYLSNLAEVTNKIDGNAGFCGDRMPYIRSGSNGNYRYTSGGGTGTIGTWYGAITRLFTHNATSVNPTFECESDSDLYTTNGSSQGNGALTYPIGLINADELAYI